MPTINGIGFSKTTPKKQYSLEMFFSFYLRIAFNVLKKQKASSVFHYYDANAGNGKPDGRPGSPLVFLETLEKISPSIDPQGIVKTEATFIEIDSTNAMELKKNVDPFHSVANIRIVNGDNQEFTQNLSSEWKFGLFYHDPNGVPNYDLLKNFAKRNKRIDLLLNVNAVAVKRCQKAFGLPSLQERLSSVSKERWLIHENGGKHQWTFLFGSNWLQFPAYKTQGFFDIESPEGKRIWEYVSMTESERLAKYQTSFDFGDGWSTYEEYLQSREFGRVRQERYRIASSKCEVCGKKGSEVHHLRYSNWKLGEVDDVDNVRVFCHACHCKAHGKEN